MRFKALHFFRNKKKLLFLVVGGGVISLVLLYLGLHEFNAYMDSPDFCNQCHDSMGPEFITYQASPHSTVDCASCHVGTGTNNLIISKVDGVKDILATITNNYERPIPSPTKTRRPASDTCEQCHWPEKFTGDLLRTNVSYSPDETNSREIDTRVLKVGGGEAEVASGIHWHISNQVWYVPLDEQLLDIGWVGVENDDGGMTEYIDPGRPNLAPERIQNEKRLMDCIDCHNRVTHLFRSPDELVDKALADGSIDSSLPFIKRKAVTALDPANPSLETAYSRVEAIKDFYKTSYAGLYAEKTEEISGAIVKLREIARLTTFPAMKVDWNTHLDNSGHDKPLADAGADWSPLSSGSESPGCFRCHGNLVASNGTLPGRVELRAISGVLPRATNGIRPGSIDADCQLCHYTLEAPLTTKLVPATSHPVDGLDSCLACHGAPEIMPFSTEHPWSTEGACAACHQSAPVSPTRLEPSRPPPVVSAITHVLDGLEGCLLCHGESAAVPLSGEHPWSTEETCVACHQSEAVPLPMQAASTPPASEITHALNELEDCLLCHGESATASFSREHPWSTNDTCTACHQAAPEPLSMPTAFTPPESEIPHVLDGLEDCLLCHGESAEASFSREHPWSTNDTCTACHEEAPVPSPLPTAFTPPASEIPHTVNGLQDCVSCHGRSARVPFPADHFGRGNEFCIFCHEPGTVLPPPPSTLRPGAALPHTIVGNEDCLLCHGTSAPLPFPVSHIGRGNDLCLFCHEPSAIPPPPPSTPTPATAVPHTIVGNEDCLLCHDTSAPLPFPASHDGRNNDLCLVCHEP